MLLANKHFVPIIGVDIHLIVIMGVPTPIPHPFIGLIFDPMDYIPFIGASSKVNFVPRGNSGSNGMLGTKVHIPMGGPFVMPPVIGHNSVNFFGSLTVKIEDLLFSPAGYMLMTCNDIGMPLTFSPGKKCVPVPSLYLPTSSTIPIPMGKPVMVGGPYVPDFAGMLKAMVMSYGFGVLLKGLGKAAGKLGALIKKKLTALNHALQKKLGATNKLSRFLCKHGFEPVDLVMGIVFYEVTDFELPGPIPIKWERTWYSDSAYKGPLGHGVHVNYDLSLHIYTEEQAIALRLPDGRITAFPLLMIENETYYLRSEKLSLTCISSRQYKLYDHNTRLTYSFSLKNKNTFRPDTLSNQSGLSILFTYNSQHQLAQITDTAGRLIVLNYDKQQRIQTIHVQAGQVKKQLVSYAYNEAGDLSAITDALQQTTSIQYQNHLMVKKTDRNGQTFYWEYDGNKTGARCIHTWGDGGILEGWIEYHKGHNIVTNSLGHQSVYYFNELNLCTQVTDPMGNHIFHEYTEDMEFYRNIDETGDATGYSYDDWGNITTITFPNGSQQQLLYDEHNNLIAQLDAQGNRTVYCYENQQLLAVVNADNSSTAFEYNEWGLVKNITNSKGDKTELRYDEAHNLIQLCLPDGSTSRWEYDPWGNCTKATNPAQQSQYFAYDALGRLTKINLPDHNSIRLRYNAYEEVIYAEDAQHKINFEYTPMGSLKMREENGVKVKFQYNTEEQLIALSNEKNENYSFVRNKKGEIIAERAFDGMQKWFERNALGRIIKVKGSDNTFSTYEYDSSGNVTRIEHSDNTWACYSYDLNGRLIEAINPNSSVKMERDALGRIIKEEQDGHIITSEYNQLGLRTKVESSLGARLDMNYTRTGQVQEFKAATEEQQWQAQLQYNALGQEIERLLPGGLKQQWRYDDAGRPCEHQVYKGTEARRKRQYQWNANERLQSTLNALTQGSVQYAYDAFGSLAWARYEDGSYDYKLPDEVGNLYKTKNREDRQYGAGGKLLENKGTRYEYNGLGFLIRKTEAGKSVSWEYTWKEDGMLQQVLRPDKKEISFEYDALGRRTAKIAEGNITRWLWDGNKPLHEWQYSLKERPETVVDEWGSLKKNKEEPISRLITWVFDEGSFRPAAKLEAGESYSIITDYLGTPVEMYNSQGEKTWGATYDIYGKVRNLDAGSLSDCPFRYQGQYEDEETGLYYNRFRYYDAETGIYISQDPIGLAGNNPNFYGYVHDSNSWVDVLGLSECGYAAKGGTQAVEGIYEFTAALGKTYVGQSGNIAARLEQHKASGKLLPGTSVRTTEVLGGKTAREIAEQLRINSLGGIKYLENIRNPIGPARQYLLPKIP